MATKRAAPSRHCFLLTTVNFSTKARSLSRWLLAPFPQKCSPRFDCVRRGRDGISSWRKTRDPCHQGPCTLGCSRGLTIRSTPADHVLLIDEIGLCTCSMSSQSQVRTLASPTMGSTSNVADPISHNATDPSPCHWADVETSHPQNPWAKAPLTPLTPTAPAIRYSRCG